MGNLNAGQRAALKNIQAFLVHPTEKFFCLNAPSGYGKSYLINHLIAEQDRFKQTLKILGHGKFKYQTIEVTATTNKAATLLKDAQTIFKLICIKPTWGNKLTDKWARLVTHSIIIIDEASYLSEEMFKYVDQYCVDCKIILIGDDCQLKCVGSSFSVFEKGFPTATLPEPMRQDPDSDLFKLCQHLRECVKKQVLPTWFKGKDIHFYNDSSYVDVVSKAFIAEEDCKILAFKNASVDTYNNAVMRILGKKHIFECGTKLVAKKYAMNGATTYPELEIVVDTIDTYQAKGMNLLNLNGKYVIPLDQSYYDQCANHKRNKDWAQYYPLYEGYHEFRLGYSLTTFKSQGSTYDKVFLDLRDIDSCADLDQKLRQIYVGVSRARTEVLIYV